MDHGRRHAIALALGALALVAVPGALGAQETLSMAELSTSTATFPEDISFHLRVTAPVAIDQAEVRYRVQQLSCGSAVASGFADVTPGRELELSWEWDLKQRGGLPVGSRITFWWILSGQGRTFETEPLTVTYEDPRFPWRSLAGERSVIRWYRGDDSFARTLLGTADAGIRQLQASTGILPSQPVEVHVYADSAAMREAIVFSQEWAGGIAYPSYGQVSIGIDAGNLDWGKRAMVHEMSHVVLAQATFFCGATVPAWLNEGLAVYNEGAEEPLPARTLRQAVAEDTAFSVRGIAGAFPTSQDGALLAYAQSRSLVAFLVDTYGPPRMNALLTAFSELGSIDRSLERVYGFDTDGLDRAWRASAGLPEKTPQLEAAAQPLPTIPPLGASLPSSEPTPERKPIVPVEAATPDPAPTATPALDTAPKGGWGCNRSGGASSSQSGGLNDGAVSMLAVGGLLMLRRKS